MASVGTLGQTDSWNDFRLQSIRTEINITFNVAGPTTLSSASSGRLVYMWVSISVHHLRAESDGIIAVFLLFTGPQSGPAGLVVSIGVGVRTIAL